MSLDVQSIVPASAIVPAITSSSKHIIAHKNVEIRPTSSAPVYSRSTTNRLQFEINSMSDFIDFSQSYLRFKLTCALNNNGADVTSKYLSEGGVHSLFRTIRVYMNGNVQVANLEDYAKYASSLSSIYHDKQFVDTHGYLYGDSVEALEFPRGSSPTGKSIAFTAAAAYADATRSLGLGVGQALSQLSVGDVIAIKHAVGGADQVGTIQSITNDNTVILDRALGDDISAAGILDIQVLTNARHLDIPARQALANQANVTVSFMPLVSFLQTEKLFPLPLAQGVRIEMDLADPEQCLVSPVGPVGTGFSGADIQLRDPVFVASMKTPDQELTQLYMDKFNGQGIVYIGEGVRSFQETFSSASGTQTARANASLRSVKKAMIKIQNLRGATTTAGTVDIGKSTYTCDSAAQALKAKLEELDIQIGAEKFPLQSPLRFEDTRNIECLVHTLKASGMYNSSMFKPRFDPQDYAEVVNTKYPHESGLQTDAQRMNVMGDLARDPSPFSGADLSNNTLLANMKWASNYQITDLGGGNAVNADRYVYMWLIYDQAVKMSAREGTTVLY